MILSQSQAFIFHNLVHSFEHLVKGGFSRFTWSCFFLALMSFLFVLTHSLPYTFIIIINVGVSNWCHFLPCDFLCCELFNTMLKWILYIFIYFIVIVILIIWLFVSCASTTHDRLYFHCTWITRLHLLLCLK